MEIGAKNGGSYVLIQEYTIIYNNINSIKSSWEEMNLGGIIYKSDGQVN